ncbi:MAG: prepilin-type N-terminal cleavage/methylation domain-containing protein, partial [Myxococcales bacterium]
MKRRGTARRARGYSLIEILVVVAIMSLLAAVAVPMVMKEYRSGQQKTALLNAQGFRQATSLWKLRTSSEECPTPDRLLRDQALVALDPEGVAPRVGRRGAAVEGLIAQQAVGGRALLRGCPELP